MVDTKSMWQRGRALSYPRGSRRRALAIMVVGGGLALAHCGRDQVARPGDTPAATEAVPGGPAAAGAAAIQRAGSAGPARVARPDTGAGAATASNDRQAVEPAPYRLVKPEERVPKPAEVHGLYLNAWAAGSRRKLQKLIDIAHRTEINTFVIDVKEGGEISYRSEVPLVREIDSDRRYIRDVQGMLERLRAAGIYPIARIVVFKDGVLARAKPEWAIEKADSSLWLDNKGKAWVDSFNKHVWDYNIAIAREAIQLGFSEVQWDYVRFPDVPPSYMRTAVWPARAGRTKEDGIREFLLYARRQLADLHAPITADVFGLTVSAHNDMGIGQLWEKMVDAVDVILPMVYPSHFAHGSYGIARPNAHPYETVHKALESAIARTDTVPHAAAIRPWLQDFTLGPPRYGADQVRTQIDAVYAAGLQEWILWNPGSNYTVSALAVRNGTPASLQGLVETSLQPRAHPVPVRLGQDTIHR